MGMLKHAAELAIRRPRVVITAWALVLVVGLGLGGAVFGELGGLGANVPGSESQEIASRLAKGIDMGEGTIYPLMRRMQVDGLVDTYLVESPAGPPRKYYRLTTAGQASFTAQKAEWSAFSAAVNEILGEAKTLGEAQ